MATTADAEIQQSTDTPSKKTRRTDTPQSTKSMGLDYQKGYPKAIKKTTMEPLLLKEDVGVLVDFELPDDTGKLLISSSILEGLLNDAGGNNKAPRYWFNALVGKHGYKDTLWFILNLKATLLNSANANLLKEWRISDKVKIPPQDVQEVGAIASLYEQKKDNEKIIDTNTKALKDYIFKDQIEERKEIILNIALGNLGGLYKQLITREGRVVEKPEARAA